MDTIFCVVCDYALEPHEHVYCDDCANDVAAEHRHEDKYDVDDDRIQDREPYDYGMIGGDSDLLGEV